MFNNIEYIDGPNKFTAHFGECDDFGRCYFQHITYAQTKKKKKRKKNESN